MEVSGLASMKASAAASTSGWKEVAPEQEMEPMRVEEPSPPLSLAEESLPVLPQPARPRPATAAAAPMTLTN